MASATIIAPVISGRIANSAVARMLTHSTIVAADLLAFVAAGASAVLLRYALHGHFFPQDYANFAPSLFLFLIVFGIFGLYPGIGTSPIEEFRLILRASSTSFLLLMGGIFLFRAATFSSRLIFLFAWCFTIVLVPLSRRLMRGFCTRQPWWGIPAVILGHYQASLNLLELLEGHRRVGLRPVAVLSPDHLRVGLPSRFPHIIYGEPSCSALLAQEYRGCYAVLAVPEADGEISREAFMQCAQHYKNLLIVPDLFGMRSLAVSTTDICGNLALRIDQPLLRLIPKLAKRCFDLAVSVAILIALSPAIIVLSVLVWLTSAGPILYGHRRIGKAGEEFVLLKFRSMILDADQVLARHLESDSTLFEEWSRDHKLRSDPRITWVGRILRKTSLDELPQLWNVIKGDMSLVGPRPIVKDEVSKYGNVYNQYCLVTPGVTGLWQISGRNNTTYDLRTRIDDYYIRNWSLSMDIYILLRTTKTLLFREGAY